MTQEIEDTKYQVAVANRTLADFGFATGILASLGHASMRVPNKPDSFVMKGRGYAIDVLAEMQPQHMIVCDLDAFLLDGPVGSSQPEEVKLHSAMYKAHSEVQAVVHLHPRFTVVMSVLESTLLPMCNEGALLVRDPLPVFPHSRLILSDEDGDEVADRIGNRQAIILRGHGAATVGGTLAEAVVTMLQLEEQARMNWYAHCAAGFGHPGIPTEDVDEWQNRYATRFELPHLKGPLERRGANETSPGQPGGVWAYYAQRAAQEMDATISS
jgi:ribulose-5-phosphate 4-epimerase/fuculose-1-phosphate aldolase